MIKFEDDLPTILEDIKNAFVFKSSQFLVSACCPLKGSNVRVCEY